jgi:hypothetical protein
MIVQVLDIALGTGEQIIGADDLMALLENTVNEVRSEKSGPPGYKNAFAAVI